MELGLFDQVGDALRAIVPAEMGDLRTQARQWGIKAWFDTETCPREHYEAQVVGARYVPAAEVLALEIGFHAEHPKPADNDAVIAAVQAAAASWRPELGDAAEVADFLGRPGWRRVSETWSDPDLSDPELCFELADRLATYIQALDPALVR